ncbi:MAG: protein phosphatase 2C domain-containing protein [Candidatus Azambacteria bacterium]|nr:protein phosphatase 2C domain-containing protein [Candidatus Azambacteria bacterium]
MIHFHSDHYFHIGRAHTASGKPCQDYAISAHNEKSALAIIADGCSSGGNTDVGARLITLATAAAITWKKRGPQEINRIRARCMRKISRSLFLKNSDLLATCAYAYLTKNSGFIHILGDGAVALKYRTGRIVFYRFDWDNNMPAYAAYADDSFHGFIAAHGGDPLLTALKREKYVYMPENGFSATETEFYTTAEGIEGMTIPITPIDIFVGLEYVAVFSDGVDQVEDIEWKDVIIRLLSFKNITGEFAKRRMIRFIKESQEIGKGPLDDIAYAVIHIAQDERKEDCDDADKESDKSNP